MKIIRTSKEQEMILEFLKGELESIRFNEKLKNILNKLQLEETIILNGDINNSLENEKRQLIMKKFRGYPSSSLFKNFPNIYKWNYVLFEKNDIDKIFYINYDYWNELSNNTSKPIEAAKNIKNGKEIFNVSNEAFLNGSKLLDNKLFPPVILITCNECKYLIIEGHSRMTIYGLRPDKFINSYGYIGYCTEEDMKKYDSRMVN